jgi:hypothetical protein
MKEINCQTKKLKSGHGTNWLTDRRSQYNLKLNLRITLQIKEQSSRQRGRPTITNPQLSKNSQRTKGENWVLVPDGCQTPTRTGQLTVGRNVTLTLTLNHNGDRG